MKKTKENKMVVFRTAFSSEMGGIKNLLIYLGKGQQTKEIHREYEKRKIFGPWGLPELARLYENFQEDNLKDATLFYCKKNVIKGLKEFISFLKNKGYITGIISSDPQFMIDVLKEKMGFDFGYGTELEIENKRATGKILKCLDRYEKAKILKQKRKDFNLAKKNVITIGRASITHLPSAKESGIFIGFDPARDDIIKIIKEENFLEP